MAELKDLKSASTASIKMGVDVGVDVSGKVTRHLPDGTTVEGSPSQEFVRIERGRLAGGDWLINPMTNETHKVIESGRDGVRIETEGGISAVAWDDVIDNLLLVVQV